MEIFHILLLFSLSKYRKLNEIFIKGSQIDKNQYFYSWLFNNLMILVKFDIIYTILVYGAIL